jgi:hypothetical protein
MIIGCNRYFDGYRRAYEYPIIILLLNVISKKNGGNENECAKRS